MISGSLGSNENLIGANLDSDGWIVGSETIELEAVEFGTHRVWLFADSPCGPDSTEFPIHVLEPGILSMQPATQEICPGDSTLAVDFEVTPSSYPITWMVLKENMLPVLPGNDYGIENLLGAGVGEASTPTWNPVHEEDEEVVLFVEARVPCPVSEPALHQITIHPATAFEPLADFSVCPGFAAEMELETNTGDLVFGLLNPQTMCKGQQPPVWHLGGRRAEQRHHPSRGHDLHLHHPQRRMPILAHGRRRDCGSFRASSCQDGCRPLSW